MNWFQRCPCKELTRTRGPESNLNKAQLGKMRIRGIKKQEAMIKRINRRRRRRKFPVRDFAEFKLQKKRNEEMNYQSHPQMKKKCR